EVRGDPARRDAKLAERLLQLLARRDDATVVVLDDLAMVEEVLGDRVRERVALVREARLCERLDVLPVRNEIAEPDRGNAESLRERARDDDVVELANELDRSFGAEHVVR